MLEEESIKNPTHINGQPTKDFFINMLVKDIELADAIGDLVDNSVDAAKKNTTKTDDYTGFRIDITASAEEFKIVDNCGGLEAKIAEDSAFCFGKPDNYQFSEFSIGQFGIGMKRAFFKIGQYIEVKSIALNSKFSMHIDVLVWKKNKDNWDFSFENSPEIIDTPLDNTKTEIIITKLNKEIANQFKDGQILIELKREIALAHLYSINKGLKIFINGEELNAPEITLINDEKIKPCYWSHKFDNNLEVEVLVGASRDKGEEGGWYVFCNDRMILGPDTSPQTGWTGGGKGLPRYHDQFYRFRGYVFFKSGDASKLPWNTSKTGMDMDSQIYQFVKQHMILMGKQVRKMLDDLKVERGNGNPKNNWKLNKVINEAKIENVVDVIAKKSSLTPKYIYPSELKTTISRGTDQIQIKFSKPGKIINQVKKYFEEPDANAAAEMAFDYFYENEIGN